MKLGIKKALGIDISQTRISLALLKKNGNGIKLLKSASVPVPAGAIENGNIKDAVILGKAVARLKRGIAASTMPTAVSLFAEPTILQVMDMPRQIPDNIGKYVLEQVKHFAALLGKKIALDFCGVSGFGTEGARASRVLAVATDHQRIAELVGMCNRAGVTTEVIEPPILACIRAVYAKKIEGKFDSNVLIALLRNNRLVLCVFRKQTIDFIRTRDISEEYAGPNEICQWLAGQINTVIQSYDVEALNVSGKWEISIMADNAQLPADSHEVLGATIAKSDVQLLTGKDICQTTVINQSRSLANSLKVDELSPVAIGLAMRLLDSDVCDLSVNLLPTETVEVRATRKRALITANIVAVLLLVMIATVIGLTWKVKEINKGNSNRKIHLIEEAHSLAEKRQLLIEQIEETSSKLKRVETILESHRGPYWSGLLSDIAKIRPNTICITYFSRGANFQVSLKGLAISNEDVYSFANTLSKSEYIDSASIFETKKDKNYNGLVSYEIRCILVEAKGV